MTLAHDKLCNVCGEIVENAVDTGINSGYGGTICLCPKCVLEAFTVVAPFIRIERLSAVNADVTEVK